MKASLSQYEGLVAIWLEGDEEPVAWSDGQPEYPPAEHLSAAKRLFPDLDQVTELSWSGKEPAQRWAKTLEERRRGKASRVKAQARESQRDLFAGMDDVEKQGREAARRRKEGAG